MNRKIIFQQPTIPTVTSPKGVWRVNCLYTSAVKLSSPCFSIANKKAPWTSCQLLLGQCSGLEAYSTFGTGIDHPRPGLNRVQARSRTEYEYCTVQYRYRAYAFAKTGEDGWTFLICKSIDTDGLSPYSVHIRDVTTVVRLPYCQKVNKQSSLCACGRLNIHRGKAWAISEDSYRQFLSAVAARHGGCYGSIHSIRKIKYLCPKDGWHHLFGLFVIAGKEMRIPPFFPDQYDVANLRWCVSVSGNECIWVDHNTCTF